jgi:hypothetical protein
MYIKLKFAVLICYINEAKIDGMKNICFLLLLLIASGAMAQEQLGRIQTQSNLYVRQMQAVPGIVPNQDVLSLPKDLKLIALSSPDGAFHRTWLIDTEGESVSSGFMPSPYFMANNNLIVVTGKPQIKRDSFNPYGAGDLPTMLLFGTVNNFISKLRIGRR